MPMDSRSADLTGHSWIEGRAEPGVDGFQALDPRTGEPLTPLFSEADADLVHAAARAAQTARMSFARLHAQGRAELLEAIADQLQSRAEPLTARAHLESALPMARLNGELGRTCGQLRAFAQALREHGSGPVRRMPGDPTRQPIPQPALVQRPLPLGPVAIFGASNFPLAFSVAGGDTASALAAGCPVVVKAHPAHPGTSELAALAIIDAIDDLDLPPGVFSLIQSSRNEVAAELVRHPAIRAVGFTGSWAGGRALCDVAAARPDPIPVYAEMGSVNPVFLLPGALSERAADLGRGMAQSLTLGEGQFCTNPGLVIAPAGEALDRFQQALSEALSAHQPGPMLTPAIGQAHLRARDRQRQANGVEVIYQGAWPDHPANPAVHGVDARHFLDQPDLQEEVFGPTTLLVRCRKAGELPGLAASLRGQLTATLHVSEDDRNLAVALVARLEHLAGRVVFNGFPTGVEVSPAMVHGGPWPACSDARSTSVGTRAMERFQRWVCYQDAPDGWLDGPVNGD